ncbi:MAG: hypothetical protein M9894_39635 [Planctomycetes bacterium]|nr:hypothetical protein [Planctomycetota bacterium]
MQVSLRVPPAVLSRLDAFIDKNEWIPRSALARLALELGIEALEDDERLLARARPVKRGPKPGKKRRPQ